MSKVNYLITSFMTFRSVAFRLCVDYSDNMFEIFKLGKWGVTTWSMMPLGRGYYEFFFSNEIDKRNVWAAGTVNLKPGVLRLFERAKDFNMHKQRNSHAQVWIRLLELPPEYWMEGTLREIACAVGTPLLIDNATTKRLFGHYARILVDMDFSRKLFHEILVEREGYAFTLEVAYEWLPDYCTHCQNVGHDVSACRQLCPRKETFAPKENIAQGKKQIPVTETTWVPRKENPSGIGSSLAFGAAFTSPVADEEHTAATENSHQLIGNQQATETEATTAALVTGTTNESEAATAALVTGTTSNAEEDNVGSEVIPETVQPQVVPLNCSPMNTEVILMRHRHMFYLRSNKSLMISVALWLRRVLR
ncbi:putative transcription factor interactor and regulator CCHC(Zn) family [Medicago truncatula]|uniref:Putative transcription factor interactor and regulator CCHC(Zn) family n=1 Tax=Medicago truncatula TaxID=3880 RepID=A0A396GXP9_MEDTR|nr:putative transcription factor interactor and regulator CCHC(Zn) family [Medicago truncatula]